MESADNIPLDFSKIPLDEMLISFDPIDVSSSRSPEIPFAIPSASGFPSPFPALLAIPSPSGLALDDQWMVQVLSGSQELPENMSSSPLRFRLESPGKSRTKGCFPPIFNNRNEAGDVIPTQDPDLFKEFHVSSHPDRLDDKVIMAGSTTENKSSLKEVQVYDPATGIWALTTNNGAYYKDSGNREFSCYIVDEKGTSGVMIIDLKKNQRVQGSIKPIPLVRSELNLIPRLVTTHILECGGSIFVCSEQEIGKDIYTCVHKFNPDSFGDGMWREIYMRLETIGGPDLQLFPEFTGVRPISATMVEFNGSAFAFSEQEAGEEVFICIQNRKRDGSGHDYWEEVSRRKRKRHRAPNWKVDEITILLKSKVEALEAVKGKPDWDFISENLEKAGFNRGPQACEDLWGTQLKNFTCIQKYVQENDIPGTSRSWASIWNMTPNGRAKHKLPRVFTLDWYEMIKIIHGKKPRKSIGGKKKFRQASTSLHNDSSVTSANSSGLVAVNFPASSLAAPTSRVPLSTESLDNFGVGDEEQKEVERRGSTDLTSEVESLVAFLVNGRQNLTNNQIAKTKDEALKIVKSKLQLEILKEKNKARDCANRRRSKSRKTFA